MPRLYSQASRHSDYFKECNELLYQSCLSKFFEPLCEAYDAGGFYVSALGQLWCILPVVAFFTVDSAEANAMCGIRCAVKSKHPCRFCWCPGEDMNDPDFDISDVLRYTDCMRSMCEELLRLKDVPRMKGFAESKEVEIGIHAQDNPLWDLPFGANPHGIYGACPPELLHQYQLGIMKYAYRMTWCKINGKSPKAGTTKSATAMRVDDRFKVFADRHVDPELPRNKFRKGVFELANLQGKEYRALLMQFIAVLGVDGGIVPRHEANQLKSVLWKVCELYDLLHDLAGHTPAKLEVIRRKSVLMMREFKHVFKGVENSTAAKNGFRFPKFHYTLHLTWAIEEWGSLRAVDTCFGEAKQADVRGDFEQTTRQPGSVHVELSMVQASNRVINQRAAGYGVALKAGPVRRLVVDRFRGDCHDYNLATGLTYPHLRLPEGVRGIGIQRALAEFSRDHDNCFGDLSQVHVALHSSMNVTAQGSSASTVFHAHPMLKQKPWYDYVSLLAGDARGGLNSTGGAATVEGEDRYAFWAGQLRVFMTVSMDGSADEHLLSLVHLFGVRRGKCNRAKVRRVAEYEYCHDIDNAETQVDAQSNVPWAYMEACVWPNGDPYLWLVETEVISTGLWVQPCFDRTDRFLFLRKGGFK
jgi:hypothetical protein